ncbi:Ig-like domain-containing protein [Persicimonas caeni]|uniref:Ig-like domain-containing protein n=1 Tax=Persicimonas caeni TaxID=2292766 RepID=UPI00143DF54C|nr:Ig-like domain-containing protein [Persicimonas caeni]
MNRRIADGEYRIQQAGESGVFRAFNRAQGLRARFSADATEVRPGEGDSAVRLRLESWGRAGKLVDAGGGDLAEGGCPDAALVDARGQCLRRLENRFAGITEWWANRAEGLEQGWTVTDPVGGSGPLIVEVRVDGARVEVDRDGQSAAFVTAHRRLRYDKLAAWDARGQTLAARMIQRSDGLAIEVDDTGAVYPVVVDPLLTTHSWSAEPNQAGALLGSSVSSAGDVNGDGLDDVIIGAPSYDNGQNNEGAAFVYHGSANGLSSTAAWVAESDQGGARFGNSVSGAGDVNGDGFDDVIVGAYFYDNGQSSEGRAFVYHGSTAGLAATPAWTSESDWSMARFGESVGGAGDVNGDGFDDIIVGAPYYGNDNEGRAFVYHGSAGGLSTSADWTADGLFNNTFFGSSVSSAGDVNGDGEDDVIIGGPGYTLGEDDEGSAFVYLGSPSGLATSSYWNVELDKVDAQFGNAVSSAGDVNGDGYDDIIVGAHTYSNGETREGRAYVFHGSALGLQGTEAWRAELNMADARFGSAVSSAGDLDGDGYDDVIVGARWYSSGESNEGGAFVYHGSANGLSTSAGWTAESNQPNAYFGSSVGSAGDVNNDGVDDIIVGASHYDNGESGEGSAFVYHSVRVNLKPNASDDTVSLDEDTSTSIDVLANDSDPDADSLSVTSVSTPSHGTATVSGSQVVYTPDANYNGTDSFTYTVGDGNGETDSATVSLTITPVNDAPQANDDPTTLAEDTPVVIDVIANDQDIEGHNLTVINVSSPAHGTTSTNGSQIVYTPDTDYHGSDSFTYTIRDLLGGTDTATVALTITPVNDAPEAVDNAGTMDEDTIVAIRVLRNDSDPDGDALTLTSVGTASHGTASIRPSHGDIRYAPDANYHGPESFTYTVGDGNGGSDTATVSLTITPVNDPPQAADDSTSLAEDTTASIDVLANDDDVDGDSLSVTNISTPSHGTTTTTGSNITYTPDANYNGADSFIYTVSDGNGGSDTATVTVNIGSGNDNPQAADDSASVDEDASTAVDVLANDTDPDGDSLSIDSVTTPANGTATIAGSQITYTPDANFHGMDSFRYTTGDGNGGSDTATVSIMVRAVPDAPVFVAPTPDDGASFSVADGETLSLTLTARDADGDTLTYDVQPLPGGASLDASTGAFTWTPSHQDAGDYQLTLSVTDGVADDTRQIDVSVTVTDTDADNDGVDDADDACPNEYGTEPDGCPEAPGADAGPDTGVDVGIDVGIDVGVDAGPDTGVDVGSDAGPDVSVDTGSDTDLVVVRPGDQAGAEEGCGCNATSGPSNATAALMVLLGLVGLRLRRRS